MSIKKIVARPKKVQLLLPNTTPIDQLKYLRLSITLKIQPSEDQLNHNSLVKVKNQKESRQRNVKAKLNLSARSLSTHQVRSQDAARIPSMRSSTQSHISRRRLKFSRQHGAKAGQSALSTAILSRITCTLLWSGHSEARVCFFNLLHTCFVLAN